MKPTVSIAVRDLVEHVLRSGDLEMTVFGAARPVESIRLHQKLQRSRPEGYRSEVPVSFTVETDTVILEIGGRIDGILVEDGRTVIEEIKTTTSDPGDMAARVNSMHWGQARCYAYFHAREEQLERIDIQLTYIHIDTGDVREARKTHTLAELEEFFSGLAASYLERAESAAAWKKRRDESIETLAFPFPAFRTGQRNMAAAVFTTIRDRGKLIARAPTGIGKTAAVLFPGIKALGAGHADRLMYLTARTTGKQVAEETLSVMRASGLSLKSLTMTAKDTICFEPEASCSGEECPFARGHFDRINGAVRDIHTHTDSFDRAAIEHHAREHRVCPFEFSLELSLLADCVICDYNYAFDPRVSLRRLVEERAGTLVFLVDEAHNLPDRARDMFSAELAKQPFLDLRRALKDRLDGLYRLLGAVNRHFLSLRKTLEGTHGRSVEDEAPQSLLRPLRRFHGAAEKWLVRNIAADFREELLERWFETGAFLRIAESYDETYVTLSEASGRDVRIRLFCIDPSRRLREALDRSAAAVFFSTTMIPAGYFSTVLGCGGSETRTIDLPSPFPPENLRIAVDGAISTLYRDRGRTKGLVAARLSALADSRRGNYLFYFPSYEYLLSVHEIFAAEASGMDIIVQERGMTEEERHAFLERFSHENERTLVGFAVMGGIFGEGIDLAGERLAGAAIVGVGLPGLSPERNVIRDYFNRQNGSGFEYAYLYPGMNRVLQAAGRVIRSETDRGVVLLIGRRFGNRSNASLFPPEWRPRRTPADPQALRGELEDFWNGG